VDSPDSVNVPVPGRVRARAQEVAADLTAGRGRGVDGLDADWQVRGAHTMVLKRLPASEPGVGRRVREALCGAPAVAARVARVDYFEEPTTGPAPVVYLAVESPGLGRLHRRLTDAFGAVEGLEGEEYLPHVTVARGGSLAGARRVAGPVDPVEWTVSGLVLWDTAREAAVGRVDLPA